MHDSHFVHLYSTQKYQDFEEFERKNLFIKVNKNIGVEPSDTAKLTMVNHPQLSPPTHNIFSNMEASEFL